LYRENTEVFKPGEEALLIAPSPLLKVLVYVSQAAFQESAANWNEKTLENFRATDAELDRLGKRFMVGHGTKVQILEAATVRAPKQSYRLLKVKLLEGREAGKLVWVEKDDVKHGFTETMNDER
jgi:hypothetical protein